MNSIEGRVIFEDNHLIAIHKLSGEIVQGDKTGDIPLSENLKEFLKQKYNKPGNVFAGVIHRLDRPVSGLVLFAKTSKALARMNELFRTRKIQKTYWAIVKNNPPSESATLIHYLTRDEARNKSRAFKEEVKNSQKAELEYRLLSRGDNYCLLEVKPLTGRHHQIRVQLAAMGCPIKGDLKYGAERSNPDGSISLHARKLEFIHPVSSQNIEILCPVPSDALWKALEKGINK